jgi:hypothetical protein
LFPADHQIVAEVAKFHRTFEVPPQKTPSVMGKMFSRMFKKPGGGDANGEEAEVNLVSLRTIYGLETA